MLRAHNAVLSQRRPWRIWWGHRTGRDHGRPASESIAILRLDSMGGWTQLKFKPGPNLNHRLRQPVPGGLLRNIIGATARAVRPHCVVATLVDFDDASGLYDRRSFLSLSKALRAFTIDVHPRKLLSVMIEDGYLPVFVFAASIALHAGRRGLCLFFLQVP